MFSNKIKKINSLKKFCYFQHSNNKPIQQYEYIINATKKSP